LTGVPMGSGSSQDMIVGTYLSAGDRYTRFYCCMPHCQINQECAQL
jgi:hypothetical protein